MASRIFVPSEKLLDYGAYTQVAYGFRKGWVCRHPGAIGVTSKIG